MHVLYHTGLVGRRFEMNRRRAIACAMICHVVFWHGELAIATMHARKSGDVEDIRNLSKINRVIGRIRIRDRQEQIPPPNPSPEDHKEGPQTKQTRTTDQSTSGTGIASAQKPG